jgi:ribosomal protein S14
MLHKYNNKEYLFRFSFLQSYFLRIFDFFSRGTVFQSLISSSISVPYLLSHSLNTCIPRMLFTDSVLCNFSPLKYKNSFFCRIHNRCVYSGRSRGIYRSVGLSRISLKKLASSGQLVGFRKVSW